MPLIQPPGPAAGSSDLTYVSAYQSIVSRVRRCGGSGSGGVVIFCGTDVDGLLGARILASLFRQDDVPYRLVPIGGYSDLEAKRDEALASEEASQMHTLILLSLGSLLDLSDYFDSLLTRCHIHVIDARRPWNLQNLFGVDNGGPADINGKEGKVWVWGDGLEWQTLHEVKDSWEALEYEPSESETSDSGDETDDDDGADEDDEEAAEEAEEVDEEESEETNQAGKRKKGGAGGKRQPDAAPDPKKKAKRDWRKPRRLPRTVREAHYKRVQRYYEAGTSHGLSVAETIYLLATELERGDNDLLWLAILAITYLYTSSRIDRDSYEFHFDLMMDEVARLNVTAGAAQATGIARTGNPDDRGITQSDEFRFMLFRHWNLYDAMLHSGYVAGRMGIWKERGKKKLQGMLAKMGFSLQQCQQAYAHMDITLKRALPEKLEAIAPEYGLVELSYPSFTRAYGFHLSSLSAADAVEGLSALLEAATGVRMEIEKEGGKNGGEWFGGTRLWNVGGVAGGASAGGKERDGKENVDPRRKDGQAEVPDTQVEGKKQAWHVTNFWVAYDACDDISLLRKSLPLAMSLHRSIIRTGSSLLDKNIIRPLRTFRFAMMREGPDLKLFTHPATLSRLALWLVDAVRDRWAEKDTKAGKKVKSLPFVVAALNEEKDTWLVVGVTGAPEFGGIRKNKFGLAFQEAAHLSKAGAKHDMFDTSVVEIKQEDLTGFIEELHLLSA